MASRPAGEEKEDKSEIGAGKLSSLRSSSGGTEYQARTEEAAVVR